PERFEGDHLAGDGLQLRRRERDGVERGVLGRDHLDDPDPRVLPVRTEEVHPGIRRGYEGLSHNIKRGVSLYSYQEEVFLGKLDLESAIAASASFGANGIEIIPEQSYDNFPNL